MFFLAKRMKVFTIEKFICNRWMAILFYIGLESLSIVENLGHIGVPLPEAIKKYLKQLSNEGKDEK